LVHTHCMLHTYSYKHTLRICRLILIAFPLQQWSHKFTSMLRLNTDCHLVILWCFSKATYPLKMAEMLVVVHILQFEKLCHKRLTSIIVVCWKYVTAYSGCSICICETWFKTTLTWHNSNERLQLHYSIETLNQLIWHSD
jgi:hypothetical protein